MSSTVTGDGFALADRRHEYLVEKAKGRETMPNYDLASVSHHSHSILSTHRNALIYKRKIFHLTV